MAWSQAIRWLGRINPFLPERRAWERRALGREWVEVPPVWSLGENPGPNPNADKVALLAEEVARDTLRRVERHPPTNEDLQRFGALGFQVLFERHSPDLPVDGHARAVEGWDRYLADYRAFFRHVPPPAPTDTPEHLFACFWQIRRAFELVFSSFAGGSSPAAHLRAATWQSIFSHDVDRYRRYLWRAMPDVPTLVTGGTGTGKELVSKAIALSGYIPFDPATRRFTHAPTWFALNLSALSPALVESELFGHRKGAFTGATEDRDGFLSLCPRGGAGCSSTKLGELPAPLQVKLLRVLEDRHVLPRGRHRRAAVRRQDRGRHAPRPAHRHPRGLVPRGSVLPPRRRPHHHPFAAGAARDGSPRAPARAARALVPDGGPDRRRRSDRRGRGADRRRPRSAVSVAGERPRARPVRPQRARAGPLRPRRRGAPTEPDGVVPLAEHVRRYVREVHARTGNYRETARLLQVDWRTVRTHVEPE